MGTHFWIRAAGPGRAGPGRRAEPGRPDFWQVWKIIIFQRKLAEIPSIIVNIQISAEKLREIIAETFEIHRIASENCTKLLIGFLTRISFVKLINYTSTDSSWIILRNFHSFSEKLDLIVIKIIKMKECENWDWAICVFVWGIVRKHQCGLYEVQYPGNKWDKLLFNSVVGNSDFRIRKCSLPDISTI